MVFFACSSVSERTTAHTTSVLYKRNTNTVVLCASAEDFCLWFCCAERMILSGLSDSITVCMFCLRTERDAHNAHNATITEPQVESIGGTDMNGVADGVNQSCRADC